MTMTMKLTRSGARSLAAALVVVKPSQILTRQSLRPLSTKSLIPKPQFLSNRAINSWIVRRNFASEDDSGVSSPTSSNVDDETARTVFVGRLSYNVDHAWLKEEFEQCGEVASSRIIVDRDGGSRGFGYVEFKTVESANEALKLDGKEIDGRPVRVDISTPRPLPGQMNPIRSRTTVLNLPPSATIYVGNLSFSTTEAAIRDHFSKYGQILSIRLPVDGVTGRPRGFGYVEFGSESEAIKIIEDAKVEVFVLDGRSLRIGFSAPRSNIQAAGPGGRSFTGSNFGAGAPY